jgi:hypothetical protein
VLKLLKKSFVHILIVLTLVLSSQSTYAQSTKAWYKPQVWPENFKIDRAACLSNSPLFTNCMIDKGWTLVDKTKWDSDRVFCRDSSKEKPGSYTECMLSKGWDENPPNALGLSKLNQQSQDLCIDEAFKAYLNKAPCAIGLENISDQSYITIVEKESMINYFKKWEEIENKRLNLLRNGGMQNKKMYEWRVTYWLPKVDENRIALINGKITYGAYNTRRKELNNEVRTVSQRFNEEVNAFINSQ